MTNLDYLLSKVYRDNNIRYYQELTLKDYPNFDFTIIYIDFLKRGNANRIIYTIIEKYFNNADRANNLVADNCNNYHEKVSILIKIK